MLAQNLKINYGLVLCVRHAQDALAAQLNVSQQMHTEALTLLKSKRARASERLEQAERQAEARN
eukprot:SAG11_NODE_18757_length_482_cov_0.783290_2_plen_63_part_01